MTRNIDDTSDKGCVPAAVLLRERGGTVAAAHSKRQQNLRDPQPADLKSHKKPKKFSNVI
jgi:hypothetical protein